MQPKPVRQIAPPNYPQREEVLAERTLLREYVPRRWRRLGGVVSLLVATNLSGCDGCFSDTTAQSTTCRPDPVVEEASDWVRSVMDKHAGFVALSATAIPILPPPEEWVEQELSEETDALQQKID